MLMKYFYNKKAQKEKKDTPYAVFTIKRVGKSDTFHTLNQRENDTLERLFTYPIHYKFDENDLPRIHKELEDMADRKLWDKSNIKWILQADYVFADFQLYGGAEVDKGIDYEYQITYELLPQPPIKEKDFSSIKKITLEGGEQ